MSGLRSGGVTPPAEAAAAECCHVHTGFTSKRSIQTRDLGQSLRRSNRTPMRLVRESWFQVRGVLLQWAKQNAARTTRGAASSRSVSAPALERHSASAPAQGQHTRLISQILTRPKWILMRKPWLPALWHDTHSVRIA